MKKIMDFYFTCTLTTAKDFKSKQTADLWLDGLRMIVQKMSEVPLFPVFQT